MINEQQIFEELSNLKLAAIKKFQENNLYD